MCKGAPCLTSLLFADDCFLFCRADGKESRQLQEIFKTYESASGHSINMAKLEFFFSTNTGREMKDQITFTLGVIECIGTDEYLGLPSIIGRSKKQMFCYLRD